mgnify:FL=1
MSKKLKVLDLFSGIGGFSLGLERTGGFETVAFCEIEKYPRKVLAKHWPDVPIYEDVKELTHERLEADGLGRIDIITGGYPCQPFSTAGERRGAEDDRHLWPEVKRLMATIRPTWGLFENVAGHISMGLDEVLSDLADEGYAAWTCIIPACAVDAPHRRDRVWILAHSKNERDVRWNRQQKNDDETSRKGVFNESGSRTNDGIKNVADTDNKGPQRRQKTGDLGSKRKRQDELTERRCYSQGSTWLSEPNVGRVAYGIPRRVDRLKGLGNAVVPQIPEIIGNAILETENV